MPYRRYGNINIRCKQQGSRAAEAISELSQPIVPDPNLVDPNVDP